MPAVNSANQLGYVVPEVTYGTAVVPTNSDAFKMIRLGPIPDQAMEQRPDKNGSLSATVGIPGLRTATWSTSMSLAPNGSPGVEPDIGPLLVAAFGKAAAIVASTSVTYELDDLQPSVSLYSYWKPGTASQYVAHGAVCNQMIFDAAAGGTFATLEFSGPARWVLDTDQFPTADSIAKAGLGTFPTEPAAPVTSGNPLSVFAGTAIFDGQPVGEIRTFRLTANMNRDLQTDVIFSGNYAGQPGQDRRDIRFDVNIYDKVGDANFSALKVKSIDKVPIDCQFTIGTTAGQRLVITLKNVLLGTAQQDDGQRSKAIAFNGCQVNATGGTTKDELKFAFT